MLARLVSASTALAALLLLATGTSAAPHSSTHAVRVLGLSNDTADDAAAIAAIAEASIPGLDPDNAVDLDARAVAEPTICGANGMLNIKCANGDIQRKANAVVRVIHTYGPGHKKMCTGWLWGNKGHIITSTHCIADQQDVNESAFEFGVEMPKCSATDTCELYKCPVAEYIPGRDNVRRVTVGKRWILLQITRGADYWVKKYGYLQISRAAPAKGNVITIIEHPNAGPKVFARTADDAGRVMPKVTSTAADPKYNYPTFRYDGDTTNEGSPGAPILSFYNGLVVLGVHFESACDNVGVPSNSLVADLSKVSGVAGNDGFK